MVNWKELGRNETNYPIGISGGSKPSDINGPKSNVILKPTNDEDHDGDPDSGASKELSEDTNGNMARGK